MAEKQPLQQVVDNEKQAPALAGTMPPTTSSESSLHKRNLDNDERDTDSNDSKRLKVILDEPKNASTSISSASAGSEIETKTVVTPTSASASASASASTTNTSTLSSSKEAAKATENTEMLDLAETLGLKAGTEIEVQWEIHNDRAKNNETETQPSSAASASENASNSTSTTADPSVSLHWWKATLLEHDGRTTDSVAIRTLQYEARPDLGFPEPSREDVVFLGRDILVTSTNSNAEHWDSDPDSVNQMPYRRVDSALGDEVFFYNDDQLEEQLNQLLMGAFQKNQKAWNSMPAAHQALIAEKIQTKKLELAAILRAEAKQNNNKVITPEAIKEILARTF